MFNQEIHQRIYDDFKNINMNQKRIDTFVDDLQLGDQGEEVLKLQEYLVELNFLRGEPNGIFGINTHRSVELFQEIYGLPITGIVDRDTWQEIVMAIDNPFPSTSTTLQYGDVGNEVKSLQQRLIILGFLNGAALGEFDEKTRESVKQFQISRELEPTGIADGRVWRELNQMFAAVSVNIPTIKPTVEFGDNNEYVMLLQQMLTAYGYFHGNVDGLFGRNTANAVIWFQETYGLEPTGVVDYVTWEVLDSLLSPNFINYPILQEGSTAPEVKILQEKLQVAGYFSNRITGSFGPETTIALKNFQTANSLPATGITDRATWEVLFSETAIIADDFFDGALTTTPIGNRPTLRYGDNNAYVKELQRDLQQLMFYTGAVDGIFGAGTLDAVKAFQVNNKLTADGIVGRNTWSALIYLYSPLAICNGEVPPPIPPEDGTIVHIVRAGDTLWSLASRFNTTVQAIRDLNNLTSDALSIGQRLLIPGTAVPPPTDHIVYTVRAGDTLWSLASRFNTTVQAIRDANNLTSDALSIGQQLIIPGVSVEPPGTDPILYTVVAGDTLSSIASRFNTTVNQIKLLNRLTSDALSIGQQLLIPRPNTLVYQVSQGDNLWSIASRFNTTVAVLRSLNNLVSDALSIGQILLVPR